MPIDVECPGCSKKYRLKDELAGKQIACKDCGKKIPIPAAGGGAKTVAKQPAGKPGAAVKKNVKKPPAEPSDDPFGDLPPMDQWEDLPEEDEDDEDDDDDDRAKKKKKAKAAAEEKAPDKLPTKAKGPVEAPPLNLNMILGIMGVFTLVGIGAVTALGMWIGPKLAGAATIAAPTDFEFVENAVGRYKVRLPKGWAVTQDNTRVTVVQGSIFIEVIAETPEVVQSSSPQLPTGSGKTDNATIRKMHDYKTAGFVEKYSAFEEDKVERKSVTGFGEIRVAEVNGKENAFRKFKGVHATLQSPQYVYTVICRCSPTQFETMKMDFEKVWKELAAF